MKVDVRFWIDLGYGKEISEDFTFDVAVPVDELGNVTGNELENFLEDKFTEWKWQNISEGWTVNDMR